MKILARIDDEGRAVPRSRYGVEKALKLRDVDVWITDRQYGLRSKSQNDRLWWIYQFIADETGCLDKDTIHAGLKREALRQGILRHDEVSAVDAEPTTVTDSETHKRYTDWIEEGCATGSLIGSVLVIPEANEGE